MRKIIQISSCGVENTMSTQCNLVVFALCNDGTVWGSRQGAYSWESLPNITQDQPPHQPDSQWKPIESAPKDGAVIILWNGLTGFNSTVGAGYWTNEIKYREDLCRADEPAGWRWSSDGRKNGMTLATHWMPLPQAPKFS